MRLETICGICERFIKLRSFGACDYCLHRLSNKRIIICKRCKKIRPIHSKGMCHGCYVLHIRTPEIHREQERQRRELFRTHIRKLNKYQSRKRRSLKRTQFDEFMTPIKIKCVKCGYHRCRRALEFHHKNRKTKRFGLNIDSWNKLPDSMPTQQKAKIFLKEMQKCVLLCSNCHREIEEKMWSLKDLTLNNQLDNIMV